MTPQFLRPPSARQNTRSSLSSRVFRLENVVVDNAQLGVGITGAVWFVGVVKGVAGDGPACAGDGDESRRSDAFCVRHGVVLRICLEIRDVTVGDVLVGETVPVGFDVS